MVDPFDPAQAVVDFSFTHPRPDDLVRAGYQGILTYLTRDSRGITRDEMHRYMDAGLRIGFIGQSTVQRPLSGFAGGVADAERYNNEAADRGAPDWAPIFYVCDVGRVTIDGVLRDFPRSGDFPAIRDYASGILASPGRPVGQYGPYPVLEMLRDLVVNGRRIEHWWQTGGGSGMVHQVGEGTGGSYHDPADGPGLRRRLSNLACVVQLVGGQRIHPPGATDHNAVVTGFDFQACSWHRDDAGPAHLLDRLRSKIMKQSVSCEGLEGLWVYVRDGEGLERRAHIDSPAAQRAMAKVGELTAKTTFLGPVPADPVVLTGDEAAWFAALPPVDERHPTAGWMVVDVVQQVVAALLAPVLAQSAAVAARVDAISAHLGGVAPVEDLEPGEIVNAVDPGTLDRIAELLSSRIEADVVEPGAGRAGRNRQPVD